MWYLFNSDRIGIGTCSYAPCFDDLKTRDYHAINSDVVYDPTLISYDDNNNIISRIIGNDELLNNIRIQRDYLLSKSDILLLDDYPTGGLSREDWISKVKLYREKLRDFPSVCNVNNPIYPIL